MENGIERCAYPDCQSRASTHLRWTGLRNLFSQLPEFPEKGVAYHMLGKHPLPGGDTTVEEKKGMTD